MTKQTALYRLYDLSDELIYVGISTDPSTRWSYHAGEKTWWPQVARKTVEWFPLRSEAEQAEIAAIAKEGPRYNVAHSVSRKPGDARKEDTGRYGYQVKFRESKTTWARFGQAAEVAGTNRSAILLAFMRWYIRRPGTKLPQRPPAGPWSTPDA